MLSFTLSIDDFVITYFTSGTLQTLPTIIYSMTRKMVSPEINALSAILFLLVLLLSFEKKGDKENLSTQRNFDNMK